MKRAIVNARVVTPDGVLRGGVLMANGRIVAVGRVRAAEADETIDARGAYVVPGFVDTHIHGGGLCDSIYGRYDPRRRRFARAMGAAERDGELQTILRTHAAFGTTAMVLDAVANDEAHVAAFLGSGARVAARRESGAARLLGLGLEGQFIKDAAYSGAQADRFHERPTPGRIARYYDLSQGLLRKVLIVPEWGREALRAIACAVRKGIVVGIGHTNGTFDEFMAGYEAGASVVIHMGNGPMSQNFKGGGALDAIFQLGDRIAQEIIFDGYHVNPRWIGAFCGNAAFNVIGVTDAMFVAGARARIREFRMGNKAGVVRGDRLSVKDRPDALYGSCLTMDRAFGNWVNLIAANAPCHFYGRLFAKAPSLDDAVAMASRILSLHPARLYGFDRDVGSIAKGKAADLIIVDVRKTRPALACEVTRVFIGGEEVPPGAVAHE